MYLKLPFTLLFILLCVTVNTTAQSYQCIPDNDVRFFINSNYYLRAIRLDSVKTINGNKVQYPFKTARGPHDAQKAAYIMHRGGSWLGNTITILPDGTHLFENHAGDTVIIRTQAALNDTWELYTDNTSHVFEATVTAIDTMTIMNGVVDSVKVITLSALDNGKLDPANYYHGKEIIISKKYGFVQAFGIYVFPVQAAGYQTTHQFDYYLKASGGGEFRLTDFKNPYKKDIYDFFPGEVFQYEAIGIYSTIGPSTVTAIDSIITRKKISNYTTEYKIRKALISYDVNYGSNGPYTTTFVEVDTYTLITNHDKLLDLNKLPEEWGAVSEIYYHPRDSNFCQVGKSYIDATTGIQYKGDTSAYASTHEPCGSGVTYQEGMGELNRSGCGRGPDDPRSHIMQFAKKHNIPCGRYTDVQKLGNEKQHDVSIYPNPAAGLVYLRLNGQQLPVKLVVANMSGSVVDEQTISAASTGLDITDYPTGVYMLRLTFTDGAVRNKKLTVVH